MSAHFSVINSFSFQVSEKFAGIILPVSPSELMRSLFSDLLPRFSLPVFPR
jgi:hypothetical protein